MWYGRSSLPWWREPAAPPSACSPDALSAQRGRQSSSRPPQPATLRSTDTALLPLLVAWVILGIDVLDVEGAETIDLHDRFALRPGVMGHAGRQMHEALSRQRRCCCPVHLLTGCDRKFPGNDRDELVFGVSMGWHGEAIGQLEAEDEGALLSRLPSRMAAWAPLGSDTGAGPHLTASPGT